MQTGGTVAAVLAVASIRRETSIMHTIRLRHLCDGAISVRSIFSLKFLLGAIVIGMGISTPTWVKLPFLQLPGLGSATQESNGVSDDRLALRIQQRIAEHPELAAYRLNLMVNVMEGVAVIGGPVPKESLGPIIESAAKSAEGVRSVRVTVWVPTAARTDPFAKILGEKLQTQTASNRTPPPPPMLLSVPDDRPKAELTRRSPEPERLPDTSRLLLEPVLSVTAADRPVVARVPGTEPTPYPTIPPTALPTQPILEDRAWTPTPATPPTETHRDPRFARLTVEVKDGVAVISGQAARYSEAWNFADELRKRPDVTRVVVGRVEVLSR
jgi:hypothetical protein